MADPKGNEVTRSIHFYRVHNGLDESHQRLAFDVRKAIRAVERLPWTENEDEVSRYLEEDNGKALACWKHDKENRVLFGRSRRKALPVVERRGVRSPLNIPPGAGILDMTHVEFFDKAIVGVMMNGFSPGTSALARYFAKKALSPKVEFELLIHPDILEQIKRMESLKTLTIKIKASYAETVKRANASLGSALEAALEAGNATEAEITISAKPRTRDTLAGDCYKMVRRILKLPNVNEGVLKFQIAGKDENNESLLIDLLQSAIVAKKVVVRPSEGSRALNSDHAFERIGEAYNEMKSELHEAVGVLVS